MPIQVYIISKNEYNERYINMDDCYTTSVNTMAINNRVGTTNT